jgi:hypothetical protein
MPQIIILVFSFMNCFNLIDVCFFILGFFLSSFDMLFSFNAFTTTYVSTIHVFITSNGCEFLF